MSFKRLEKILVSLMNYNFLFLVKDDVWTIQ